MADRVIPKIKAESVRMRRAFLRRLARVALARVRASLVGISRTLRKSARVLGPDETGDEAVVDIPEYWAVFVHGGRRAFTHPTGGLLLWFENPRDDPRTQGTKRYPVTKDQVRSMRDFPEAYKRGLEENARRRRAAGPGNPWKPFMVLRRSTGPVAPRPFMRNATVGISTEADKIAAEEFARMVKRLGLVPKDEVVASTTKL